MDPGQVFCLQWNGSEGSYDLTVHSQALYDRVLGTCKEKAELAPFSSFRVEPLCKRNIRIITVHVYNPYVGDEAVAMFLSRYGMVDKTAKYLKDSYGIWSGRRQFRVHLGDDPDSSDGLQHPPAYFSIGADRGFLFYSGQPSFCRQCRSFGHLAAGCAWVRCRNCGSPGHGAASCAAPRACHGCGAEGHLLKECPSRVRTYADAAGVVQAPSLRPLQEVLEEIRVTAGVPLAEVAVTIPGKGPATEIAPDGGAEAAAEGSIALGEPSVDADLLVSLGDSLPLVGSWADYGMQSEEEPVAETGSGGGRRRKASSGGELMESSAEAVRLEPMVQVRRRKKKRKENRDGSRTAAAGAPLTLIGRYDALSGSQEEEGSSGGAAEGGGVPGLITGDRHMGQDAEVMGAGHIIGSTGFSRADDSGLAQRPVDLEPVSPLSPARSFHGAGSPSSVAYLPESEPSDPEGSPGAETEGTGRESGGVLPS